MPDVFQLILELAYMEKAEGSGISMSEIQGLELTYTMYCDDRKY